MNKDVDIWGRPDWRVFLVLPLLHYVAIQISYFCGKTAENEAIIWLPSCWAAA